MNKYIMKSLGLVLNQSSKVSVCVALHSNDKSLLTALKKD